MVVSNQSLTPTLNIQSQATTSTNLTNNHISTISHSSINQAIHNLLNNEFEVLKTADCSRPSISRTAHSIPVIECHPCVARPRELAPERLAIAKEEFESLESAGIIRTICFRLGITIAYGTQKGRIMATVW